MYGLDLDVELAAGRYGWLLDRILDLPDPYSRFREAMSEDEEMAELLLELEDTRHPDEEGEGPTLRYSQVGLREHLLMSIDMGIKAMRAEAPVIAGVTKSKPAYPDMWPMPVTALERLRHERELEQAESLAAAFGVSEDDATGAPSKKKPPKPAPEKAQPSGPAPTNPDMRRVWYASRLGE